MALQFILGNSGSGKTYFIHRKIVKEADENPKKNYLVIVPEQFTMQTQRQLVQMQENHSIMNIDVLSFQRLAYRVFDELGTFSYQVLEETGKNLILRRVAEEKSDQLMVLKKNMKKMGYIGEVKSLISELSQYNVTPSQLEKIVEEFPQGSFSYKLQDVLTMYQGFLDFLEDRFVTAEEVLELLMEVADQSKILRGSVIVLDGFTGFTPIQNNLLKKLFGIAEQIYVTVTIDIRENPYHCTGNHELFAMSKKMIASLMKMAEETHIEVKEPLKLEHGTNSRFRESGSLFFLEQNLFRSSRKRYLPAEAAEEIKISSLQNPREELDYVAREIERLVRNQNYRYQDIAIVCGDLPAYDNYAREVFANYEIPLFLDQKTTIVFHPFIEFLRSLIEVILQKFSYESIFRYLRSGLSQIPREEIDLLENYVLAAGIRGYRKWSERFCYLPKGYGESDLEPINEIRQKVAEQFRDLWESFSKKEITVREQSQAIYTFLCDREAEKQLRQKERELEAAGDLKSAREYAQIYRIVMDLFDKMVELLGDEILPLEEYAKILDAGFEAAKVGVIPPGYDRIVFGDIERTRLDDLKVLFFVGVNDGLIPKSGGADGILSQLERDLLAEQKIELAPTVREKTFIQKFYLYLNLTKPSQKLYLSYARVDGEGKALRCSYLIPAILKMYDSLTVNEIEQESFGERIVTEKNSISLLAEGLEHAAEWQRKGNTKDQMLWAALCRWYQDRPQWREKVKSLASAAQMKHQDTPIAAAVTKVLYGSVLENSVTRLEKFASCAFAHFLSYGLELQERKLHQFAAVDIGNIFHEVLALYAEKMKQDGYSWFTITEAESEQLLQDSVEEALGRNHNLALYDNARNSYAKKRMQRILKRTIWALTSQVRQGRFTPDGFEVSFAYAEDMDSVNFSLSEEEKMHLRGRIDRIDTLEDENKLYVKVIDYKSGNTSFQFLNIYHGLQLQLVVYMNAALELMEKRHPEKEVIPAGIFYYHVKDPMIEEDGRISEEELRTKILKELKLNGLANADRDILEKLDSNLEAGAGVSSDVISVGMNKDGSLKKTSKVMESEDFHALSSYVNETILHLGQRILKGDISVSPYALAERSGCDYCEYRAVCQFDPKIPGFRYRNLEELSDEEVIEKMKGGRD